ncbi:hypothetical protein AnigIFM62618_008538 [Aspergillus niger]|nr:hypothetical protein AnigIFM62618_008538 [Aspergillus niger]
MGSHKPNHHFGVYRRVKGRIKDHFHTAVDDDESCTTLSAATSAPTPTRDQAIQGEENSPTPNNPGLWEEAFGQLEYNDQVALMSNPTNATDNNEPTSSGLEDVLDKVIETVKTQSEIRKLKSDTRISEGARAILNAALALQSNISALVASDPTGHASSAWAVISLGLTITQNYREQQDVWLQSSGFLSDTISRASLIEARFYQDAGSETKEAMKDALVQTYLNILRYSAEVMRIYGSGTSKKILKTISEMGNVSLKSIQTSIEDKWAKLKEWVDIERDLNYNIKADTILARVDEVLAELQGIRTEMDLLNLPVAANASFDSYSSKPEPECLAGTRVDLLQTISDWTDDPHGKPLFWLNGMAGTGKSTISRTVARMMRERGILAGSFFFQRNESDRSSSAKLLPTLLSQMVRVLPQLKAGLRDAAGFAKAAIPIQFDKLLSNPLQYVKTSNGQSFSIVVVIDALDECSDTENIQNLLVLLPRLKDVASSVNIKFFLTSRPEVPIQVGFEDVSNDHQYAVLHEINQSVVEHDMALFFDHTLENVRRKRKLDRSWPGEDSINKLVELAVPLFIFAATINRLFLDYRFDPIESLDNILGHQDEQSKLARIYLPVLDKQVEGLMDKQKSQIIRETQDVVGAIVILQDPLAIPPLAELIQLSLTSVQTRVQSLASVLSVPADASQPVKLFHKSFQEFFLDPATKHKNQFWVDEGEVNRKLAFDCIRVMERPRGGLRKNIYDLDSYGFMRQDIDYTILQEKIPSELQYACRYWVHHLRRGGVTLSSEDLIHKFLKQQFLHWLEAMSILGYMPETIRIVNTLQSFLKGQAESNIAGFLRDAKRFLVKNLHNAEKAPLQLYASALNFSPRKSIIKSTFDKERIECISRLSVPGSDWGPILQTIKTDSWQSLPGIAVSPDGVLIATTSDKGEPSLWSLASGSLQPQQVLAPQTGPIKFVAFSPTASSLATCEKDFVRVWSISSGLALLRRTLDVKAKSVAFSPDGTILAVALDERVQVRDSEWLSLLLEFRGYAPIAFSPNGRYLVIQDDYGPLTAYNTESGWVQHTLSTDGSALTSVAFSPDSQYLVSGCMDFTVKLFSVDSGILQHIFEGHTQPVLSVAYSPDGKFIASASADGNMRLWSASSHTLLATLQDRFFGSYTMSITSDSKRLITITHDGIITVWDVSYLLTQDVPITSQEPIKRLMISPDQTFVLSVTDHGITVWDVASLGCHCVIRVESQPNAIAFSPEGSMISSGGENNSALLWNINSGDLLESFRGHAGAVSCTAISSCSALMASGSNDHSIRIWDLSTNLCMHVLSIPGEEPRALAFSQNHELLACISSENTVELWDTASGILQWTLLAADAWPTFSYPSLAFSPDDIFLIGKHLRAMNVWSMLSHTLVYELPGNVEVPYFPHSDDVSFSDDGTHMITKRNLYRITGNEHIGNVSSIVPQNQLELKDGWVEWKGDKVLWIPPEYQPEDMIVTTDDLLIIGNWSGNVIFIQLDTTPEEAAVQRLPQS